MNSDSPEQREYTAEYIALVNAEPPIDPFTCNYCIKTALQRNLPGGKKAKENFDEIMKLIIRGVLKPCRSEEISEKVWVPHRLTCRETGKADRLKGCYRDELLAIRHYFSYETAQSYYPGMGAFQNPFMKKGTDLKLDHSDKELECLRLMLACMMRHTLTEPKFNGANSISARAKYFQRLATEFLENPRGFGNSTLRARIKDIDSLMSERKKLEE